MKPLLYTGAFGSLVGAILGLAVWLGIQLFSTTEDRNFAVQFYRGEESLKAVGSLSPGGRDDAVAELVVAALRGGDPRYEAVAVGAIVYGQFLARDLDAARSTFGLLSKPDERWDALFYLERQFRGRGDAREAAMFLRSLMPADDARRSRLLMTLLGTQYLKANAAGDARLAFREAARFHTLAGDDPKLSANAKTGEDASKRRLLSENQESLHQGFTLGRLAILSIFLAVLGFILSIVLKPALEAFGRAVLAPAIASRLRSEEMLRELKRAESGHQD